MFNTNDTITAAATEEFMGLQPMNYDLASSERGAQSLLEDCLEQWKKGYLEASLQVQDPFFRSLGRVSVELVSADTIGKRMGVVGTPQFQECFALEAEYLEQGMVLVTTHLYRKDQDWSSEPVMVSLLDGQAFLATVLRSWEFISSHGERTKALA